MRARQTGNRRREPWPAASPLAPRPDDPARATSTVVPNLASQVTSDNHNFVGTTAVSTSQTETRGTMLALTSHCTATNTKHPRHARRCSGAPRRACRSPWGPGAGTSGRRASRQTDAPRGSLWSRKACWSTASRLDQGPTSQATRKKSRPRRCGKRHRWDTVAATAAAMSHRCFREGWDAGWLGRVGLVRLTRWWCERHCGGRLPGAPPEMGWRRGANVGCGMWDEMRDVGRGRRWEYGTE
jgi:hypothetical protein